MPSRRLFLLLAFAFALAAPAVAAPQKVLRYALEIAETGFDPAQVSDVYSREIIDNIIESPLRFDQLARPIALRTATAAALPEMSADFRELTLRIRPGIFFADDPAFHGRPRELTAADYAYSIRRHFDPRLHSDGYSDLLQDDILGLQALREKAQAHDAPFDYDAPVDGLQLLDRYTLRLRFGHPSPRFVLKLAQTLYSGAVAREVVEAWGPAIMEHPVGTGPYRLVQWRRASLIILERNPRFRAETWDEHPAADDAEGQALARRLRGRALPMIDRVEVSIIEEAQPAWLAYLGGDFDLTALRNEFVNVAAPRGRLAPNLARQGMQIHLVPRPDVVYTFFNMEDPVVGGYAPEKVALRRAIGLAYDNAGEIRLLRKQLGVPAQGLVVPLMPEYDPALRSGMSEFNPDRARALLDLFGYVDRDGDGWRELPDGRPLALQFATQNDSSSRQLNELWLKSLTAIGIHVGFDRQQWPTQLQRARAGKLQMWALSQTAAAPNVDDLFAIAYGPQKGEQNLSRFDLPAYNADVRRMFELPDGPEREAAIADAQKLLLAYLPIKAHVHRVRPFVTQRWMIGYPRNQFVYDWWRYVDIDLARRPAP
jgi:ABC-type transport system substrate-binding protein